MATLIQRSSVGLAALVIASLASCGEDRPPEPVVQEPTVDTRAREILVLLESSKQRCLEHAQELVASPFNPEAAGADAVSVGERLYHPETVRVLTMTSKLRDTTDRMIKDFVVDFDTESELVAGFRLLARAEEGLCRTLEFLDSEKTPNEARIEQHLSDFLAEFRTIGRRFPITDLDRAAILQAHEPVIAQAAKAAEDKLLAHHEASEAFEETQLAREAETASFFKPKETGPRPLGPAESAAVELAAKYLEQGPWAWTEAFAAESAWSPLESGERRAELLARLGPNSEVTWTAQKPSRTLAENVAIFHIEHASGFDETVLIELVQQAGDWKISRIATQFDRPEPRTGVASVAPAPPVATTLSMRMTPAALAVLFTVGCLLLLVSPHRRSGRASVAGLAILLVFGCTQEAVDQVVPVPPPAPEPPRLERLAELVPLKVAISEHRPGSSQPGFEDYIGLGSGRGEVASLWQAQWLLHGFDLDGAEGVLESLANTDRPLVHLLRARLSYFRGELDELESAYLNAQIHGLDNDGLRLEAAQAFAAVGLESQAEAALDGIGEMGSRQSLPYFAMARLHARNGRTDDAKKAFIEAWELAPLPRRYVFEDGALAWLAARPEIQTRLEVSSPNEPLVGPGSDGSDGPARTRLPAGFESIVSGKFLRVTIGGNELEVPGGASMAPVTARVTAATELDRRSQEDALSELATLETSTERLALALTQPKSVAAIDSLARSNQWARLVTLTEGTLGHIDRMSPQVVKLRALALDRLDRGAEAKKLLLALARNDRTNKRRDPDMYFQLGELLVKTGEYDTAIRLIERGNALSSVFGRPYRIRQIRMEKKLAGDQNTYTGQGFEVRYPRVSGKDYPVKVARVLTAERRRINRWVPLASRVPIKIDLYPFMEFMTAYGGPLSIVGLFDGRVRVPFADLQSLHPRIVSILSHELAHAMIAAKTNDNAPKWFHEGLAQHIEMDQPINPIPDLMAKGRVLSLPVVEAVLGGMAERQYVELAYSQSVWAIHYVEAAFGVRGIHALLDEFAKGSTTDQAIENGLGLSLEKFDRRVWEWCANEAPTTWKVEVRRYDREINSLIGGRAVAKRDDLPLLRREKNKPARPKRRASRAVMTLWYNSYDKAVKGVNATLLPVLRMGTKQARWDQGAACSALLRELSDFQPKRTVLNTPDPDLSLAVAELFGSAEKLARSCTAGPTASTQQLIQTTLSRLSTANRHLTRHGLIE